MGSLVERYDALFIDLDGVVYRGDRPVAGAVQALPEIRGQGARILFLTNNSSRTPDEVAGKLEGLGVAARSDEVLTSGVATASMLRREGGRGRTAFVIGERGIREALEHAGVRILDGEADRADLVVVGWDRSVDYPKLRTAALLVQRGARLVATNADASYPAPDGLWPGAGAILAAVTTTTGATPTVIGKPARPLFEEAADLTGAVHPLVIGDRLDTDVSGAQGAGWDSLLVFTGASRPPDLLHAEHLPTYVGDDLAAVLRGPAPARFRRAGPADVPGIRALLGSAGLSAAGVERRLNDTVVCDERAEGDDGEVVATACLQGIEGFGILRSVAVREDHRGLGLGMLAVAAAVRTTRDRGLGHVSLFTEGAEGFFEKVGFRRSERADLPEPVRTSEHAAEECAASATPMTLTP
ncbi:MAG TPA: HAD-IIA family hydrolase [Actinomycetota bacterium]